MKPLAIDLFCGLGGWTEGFLAEGWNVVGFDIERHVYGDKHYPAQLVLQDALTLHGSQFRNADIIVCSPPCQKYSYLAMPWSRSKPEKCKACDGQGSWIGIPCLTCKQTGIVEHSQAAKALRREWEANGPDNRLFDACFRIQKEAIVATGIECPNCDTGWPGGRMCPTCRGAGALNTRFIPLVVENVRGAQPWVGKAAWSFGSFYLWGDVPALMPIGGRAKNGGGSSWFPISSSGKAQKSYDPRATPIQPDGTRLMPNDGVKSGGDWFGTGGDCSLQRKAGSRSHARKAASAQIAKIPFELSSWIARVYKPESRAA